MTARTRFQFGYYTRLGILGGLEHSYHKRGVCRFFFLFGLDNGCHQSSQLDRAAKLGPSML